MIAKAENKFIRVAPRKVREIIDLLRGEDVVKAQRLLSTISKRPKVTIAKTLESAIANARVKGLDLERLYVSRISADQGPMWKRFRAVSFGRAAKILKRTTHLKIELDIKNK